MKKIVIYVFAACFLSSAFPPCCGAEKIYYKDGQAVKGEVTSRGKGIIWVKSGDGMSVGVSTKKVKKIENDDGSVSKYDYEALEKTINRCIREAQYAEAARLCGIFLEAVPDYTRLHYLRGMLNQKLGNLKEAAADYDFLIAKNAADAKIYNNRGIISACDKDYDRAASFFRRAIERVPKMAEARNNLGNTYMQQKDYGKAIVEYKKVIALEPKNTAVLFNLGYAYNNMGYRKIAEKQWRKILHIDPKNEDAKKALKTK